MKNLNYLSETVRDSAISTKFLTRWVSAESSGNFFLKIVFPPFLVLTGHLEFLLKTQKHIYLGNSVTESDLGECIGEIFDLQSHVPIFPKNRFPTHGVFAV